MLQVSNAQHKSIRACQNWGTKEEIGGALNENQKNGKHGQVHLCDARKRVLPHMAYNAYSVKTDFFKSNQLRSNFEAFAPDQSSKAQSPGSPHALISALWIICHFNNQLSDLKKYLFCIYLLCHIKSDQIRPDQTISYQIRSNHIISFQILSDHILWYFA